MTFLTGAWAVDGNQSSAQLARLMNQAATLGSQGVIGHLDCIVRATSPATAGIIIGPGGTAILGAEASYQGSYTGWNVGDDSTLAIASTGGSPRSDMIVARAEDPTWSGSPWGNPAAGQIVFPRVISGVSSSATQPPAGTSAIPLARIDMPASTAAVQAGYIHDLRQVATPQVVTGVVAASGPGSGTQWTVSTTPHAWPPGAAWTVQVPAFATACTISWMISNVYCANVNWARGYLYPILGASVTSPALSWPQTLVSVLPTTGPGYRMPIVGGAAAVAIGPSLRGTTQTLQFAQITDGTQTGTISVDEGSQYIVTYQFKQLAALT